MGCSLSSENHDKSIMDRSIQSDKRPAPKKCKILILGSGESGKSTVIKQMKIILQNGYTEQELLQFRFTVLQNLINSAQALVTALRKFDMELQKCNRIHAERILEYELVASAVCIEIVDSIENVWRDPVIPQLLDRRNQFYLMDSAGHFFDNARRIGAFGYVPTQTDVLMARTKTLEITETRLSTEKLDIHMYDVGGQRSERAKWIHTFDQVTSIIFCVALSEYDQVLLEHSDQNRMTESLILFESIINAQYFLRTSIILFLNKVDLFRAKIPKVPLKLYFGDYEGEGDVNKAAKYILWRFTQHNRQGLSIYPHLTQATDTRNIQLVFSAVKETVLQNTLKDSGIL